MPGTCWKKPFEKVKVSFTNKYADYRLKLTPQFRAFSPLIRA